ncbi:glycoside hydrolase family 99-like domain-containing protein [Paenibacillus sp. BC26]|uniref:glycoside hydrolase family 99-like domain-containing protein n=1 Tax=Paenibacillus sp. BC26 TaxID=1881032 RepID=UPI0008E3BBB3|nr:glycoside hydrolase family 99-like domain-containing protein [Paenibacillus sp. BC26]SFT14376.1 Glycosyltransferase WbsX [Paenibacillus sp. BC26]
MAEHNQPYEVAVYYFPQWHPDPKNEATKGEGWTEWPSLRVAKPVFAGHEQPKVPLWGELDESDPAVSEKQIDAAADHGITSFIYDWYWDMGGGEGPFLHRALEDGFLQAPNRDRLRFGIMWANHNEVSRERFDAMTDYLIIRYFNEPNFLKIEGKLYFSIYECHTLIKGLGGIAETRDALQSFREKTREAGCGELHLNLVEWGLNEANRDIIGPDTNELIRTLSIDSVTSYVWIHHVEPASFPDSPYADCASEAVAKWPEFRDAFEVPYYPNSTMGWDPSPRCRQDIPLVRGEYPYTPILTGNTPEAFEANLQEVKGYLDQSDLATRMFTIYAWNEWTEGGYLEPDTIHGMKYLEAIRNVFGK